MEKFRKVIQIRLVGACIYDVLLITLVVILQFTSFGAKEGSMQALGQSFGMGAGTGILLVTLYFVRKYAIVLRNEDKLKALYIEEKDERKSFIYAKIGGSSMNFIIMSATLSTIVAGYLNETVFVTLIAVTLFISLVRGFLKIYYNKKY